MDIDVINYWLVYWSNEPECFKKVFKSTPKIVREMMQIINKLVNTKDVVKVQFLVDKRSAEGCATSMKEV
jgi:hypothetical protein